MALTMGAPREPNGNRAFNKLGRPKGAGDAATAAIVLRREGKVACVCFAGRELVAFDAAELCFD